MRRADAPIAYGHAQKPEYVPVALRASVFIESRRFRAAVRKRPVAFKSGGIGRKREKNTEKRGADERFEQRVFLPALPGRLRAAGNPLLVLSAERAPFQGPKHLHRRGFQLLAHDLQDRGLLLGAYRRAGQLQRLFQHLRP